MSQKRIPPSLVVFFILVCDYFIASCAFATASFILLQIFSVPIFLSKPDLTSTRRTCSFTPERIMCICSACDRRNRFSRLCNPVESIKGTLRMRMMRIFGLSPILCMISSNLLATPKKNGPSISYTYTPLGKERTSSSW